MAKKSRHSLDGPAITIRAGLAIYKTLASPFYFARIWNAKSKKYVVRSTKETTRIEARKVAEETYQSLHQSGALTQAPREMTFQHFAEQAIKQAQFDVASGIRRQTHIKDIRYVLEQPSWGLLKQFGNNDIREIQTKDFYEYINKVQQENPHFSASTHQSIRGGFRKVMLHALQAGVITQRPEAPKVNKSNKSVPRTFFRFYPIVSREQDEYRLLCKLAEDAAKERVQVRGTPITTELRDIIQFMVNSFVRPTYSELFALKHSDIAFRNDWLVLTIRRGKTGFRLTDTMPAAAGIYKRRLGKKTPNPDDYVFLPEYKNRKTAHRVISRQLNYLLDRAGLKRDKETGKVHSLYSLRHLSLAMRVLNSSGTADLLLLAQNAGTSHRMLELFYLNNLPRPEDDVRRLQTIKRSKEDITKK